MGRVVWTDEAFETLDRITDYVAAFNQGAAEHLSRRLIAAAESLADYPERGKPLSNGLRQLGTIYPYLIRYRVRDGEVLILRIRHGARL